MDGVRGEDYREAHAAFVGRKTTREEDPFPMKGYGLVG
jgi:hypothetical protein